MSRAFRVIVLVAMLANCAAPPAALAPHGPASLQLVPPGYYHVDAPHVRGAPLPNTAPAPSAAPDVRDLEAIGAEIDTLKQKLPK